MNNYQLLLKNAKTIDSQGNVENNINIAIKDGFIEYVGKEVNNAKKVIDCTNKFVTPSFINTHSHAPMSLLRGLAEDVNIDSWFNDYMWLYESSLSEEDVYFGSKLGFYELINNGVTISAEHYFMPESIIKAAKDTGIKLDLSPTFFSGDEAKDVIRKTTKLHNEYIDDNQIDISFGPHSTYLANEEDLKEISKISLEKNMKIHLHIGESKEQVETHIDKYGETPIKWLNNLGVLDNHVILAHNLYYKKEDLKYLNDNHLVSYCPKTYYKLAMGLPNIVDNELNYSFGTDGAASNATMNITEQARLFAMYQKDHNQNAEIANIKSIWQKMFKAHNHFKFKTGEIKENYSADLIIWDLDKPNTMPIVDPLFSILYSSDSGNIETVISNGELLKENFVIKGFDKKFKKNINKSINKLLEIGKKEAKYKF